MKKETIVAIIPARGGSQGIPRKNIKLLGGKPLIAYSIESALHAGSVDRVIVSTEDDQISEIAREYGAEVIARPEELAEHTTATEPVLEHTVRSWEQENSQLVDWVMLLQPTSPFREKDDLDNAFTQLKKTGADTLLSVSEHHGFLWKPAPEGGEGLFQPVNYDFTNRPRRQEMNQYQENGSIYITKRSFLMENHCRLGGNVAAYKMLQENSLEIDTLWDWFLAEQLIKKRGNA